MLLQFFLTIYLQIQIISFKYKMVVIFLDNNSFCGYKIWIAVIFKVIITYQKI